MLRRFVRDILTYLPSKLLPAITGMITVPILTRLFLPEDYGNYALAAGLPALLFALAGSGYRASVTRFYPAYKTRAGEHLLCHPRRLSHGGHPRGGGDHCAEHLCLQGLIPERLYPLSSQRSSSSSRLLFLPLMG